MDLATTPLWVLFIVLIALFFLSAFFSGSETALMALNRYKLKHLAKKNSGAYKAQKLLQQPDRLIGLILLGNNLVNIIIIQIATFIGFKIGGSSGVAIATAILTLALLIFAEVTPKTIAALRAEKIAFPAAIIFTPLLKIAFPIVWLINIASNFFVRFFGADPSKNIETSLNREELKTIVSDSSSSFKNNHKNMLISVLDLESTTVEDIMVPRADIVGIDLNDDWNDVEEQILRSTFTRLLVYKERLDQAEGIVHLRKLIPYIHENRLTRETLIKTMVPTYFTPNATPLTTQLLNFQNEKKRVAIVVDEYGEILGMVTLEDLLEEIVQEFSGSIDPLEIKEMNKDTYWLDGGMHIRDVNRRLNIQLPTEGPKTLNGLILEKLESIPTIGTTTLINGYPLEIRKVQNNAVKNLVLHPLVVFDENNDSESNEQAGN
ncbi:MAG TPA: HlyC/CorC family transporter [Leucothrix mucor]|nr:HlyC/CorC family transporter [Leucothrix mucor]